MNHHGLQERSSNPGRRPFILKILPLFRARVMMRLGSLFVGWVSCRVQLQAAALHPANPTGSQPVFPSRAVFSHTHHSCLVSSSLLLYHISIHNSGTGRCSVSHRTPFSPALHTDVHCNELLACFKVSDFCYTINTGYWLRLLSDNPVVVLYHRDPAALVLWDKLLHTLQQLIDGIDVGVDQLKTLDLSLGGSWVGQPGSLSQVSPVFESGSHDLTWMTWNLMWRPCWPDLKEICLPPKFWE